MNLRLIGYKALVKWGLVLGVIALTIAAAAGDDRESFIELIVEMQACHTDEFDLAFDDAARARFRECAEPLADYEFWIADNSRQLDFVRLDENGHGVLERVLVRIDSDVMLAVCSDTYCFKYRFKAGRTPMTEGEHFVFYADGLTGADEE